MIRVSVIFWLLVVEGVLLLASRPALAHPPWSLVMDQQNVVYYSDLTHVWMIRPDGTKTIAIQNVHTHELWIDREGCLVGEDVANVGERYRHRIWRRGLDGVVTDVMPFREGHPGDYNDYSFARDNAGRSYILLRDERRIDVMTNGERARSVLFENTPGEPGRLTVNPVSIVHFTVGADLYDWRYPSRRATLLASNLIERTQAFDFVHDRHALMGLWSDTSANTYVAVYAGQVVKRISPEGTVTIAARSSGLWSPTGGFVAPDGALWLLEWSASNEVRVRRLSADSTERVF